MANPAPAAPVKAPSKLPSFLTDLIVKYALDAAPTLGTAASKSLNGLLQKVGQPAMSPIEEAHVAGVVVMTVTRLTSVLKSKI
jgi:hypothetical protein